MLRLLLILPVLASLAAPTAARADRTQNRQLYTLCTLGASGSYRAKDCRILWAKCEAYDDHWSDRNCRIQFYPSARRQAERLVQRTLRQHGTSPGRR